MPNETTQRRPRSVRTPISPDERDRIIRTFADVWETGYLAGEPFPVLRALAHTPAWHQRHIEEWLFTTVRAAQPNAFPPKAEA